MNFTCLTMKFHKLLYTNQGVSCLQEMQWKAEKWEVTILCMKKLLDQKIHNYHKWHYKVLLSFKSQHLRHWICLVYKMISISILILASFSTCIKCFQLTNSNFVADIATHFNRLGIIYHLPSMTRSDVFRYHKTISKFRYFEINYLLS